MEGMDVFFGLSFEQAVARSSSSLSSGRGRGEAGLVLGEPLRGHLE